jgi:NitT/TauT family transport system substrate-binding protein
MSGMKKQGLILVLVLGIVTSGMIGCAPREEAIGMAVEFMDHAASAYLSQNKGWFKKSGLTLRSYESYTTGMALASALARGDIDVAYICLVPAINTYANAGVPIRIVSGTHKYGYALVVNPDKIESVGDLEKPGRRIGCVREGGAVDVLLHKTIDKYKLDENKVLDNIQRMNPPKQILAIKMGKLDGAFLPEQWATMAEDFGFKMLLMSQDVWPKMQGSVLVVKEELIKERPDVVRRLVKVSQQSTDWINRHPAEAAEVLVEQLSMAGTGLFPAVAAEVAVKLEISPGVLARSMDRLEYSTDVDPEVVQETIDYLVQLGYIKRSFPAEEILDLSFLEK